MLLVFLLTFYSYKMYCLFTVYCPLIISFKIYFKFFKLMYHFYLLTTLAFYCLVCPSLAWPSNTVPRDFEGYRNLRKAIEKKEGWNISQVFFFFIKMSFKYLVAIQKKMCYRIIDCFRLD